MTLWGCILTLPRLEDVVFKSNKYLICDKCGALKTSKGNICPICHPEAPYNTNTDKFIYSDCLLLSESSTVTQNQANPDILPFSTTICFAFDISSSSSLFQQIIYSITSNDFQREFKDCGFIFAFLIKDTTIFVTRQEDGKSDNFSFDKIPPLEKTRFFTSENLGNALIDAFSIIQVMVLDLFVTDRSFSILFSELSKNIFNTDTKSSKKSIFIDHLFLFYASTLSISKKHKYDLRFYVHCIELNDKKTIEKKYLNIKMSESGKATSFDNFSFYQSRSRKEKSLDNLKIDSSPLTSTSNSIKNPNQFESEVHSSNYDSVLIAFQNGWTHSIISANDSHSIQLIEYIKFCIKPILPKQVKISLHMSPELEVSWISSNKYLSPSAVNSKSRITASNDNFNTGIKNKQKNFATVVVNNFQSDFMLHVTFQQIQKLASSYEKAKYFTLQVIFEFVNGQTFISNRSWKKAASLPKNAASSNLNFSHEWSDSINVAPFCMICLKQRASLFLMNYISKSLNNNTNNNGSNSNGNSGGLNHSSFFRRRFSVSSTSSTGSTAMTATASATSSSSNSSASRMLSGKPTFTFNWTGKGESGSSVKFNNADLWDVGFCHTISNQEIFSPSLSIVRQIVELFNSLFIDDNSPINEKIRLDIIYLTMTQGFGYFVSLFNSLFTLLKNSDVLYFPPFFIVSREIDGFLKKEPPDLSDKNQDKAVFLSTVRIELDEEEIQAIKSTIANAIKQF